MQFDILFAIFFFFINLFGDLIENIGEISVSIFLCGTIYLLIKVKSHIQNMIMKMRTFDKREKCNASSSDKYILKSSK